MTQAPAQYAIDGARARRLPALGLRWDDDVLVVGLPDSWSGSQVEEAIKEIHRHVPVKLRPQPMIEAELRETLEFYINSGEISALKSFSNTAAVEAGAEGPIADLVNQIVERAVRLRASDIHVEPTESDLLIRVRVDGALEDLAHFPSNVAAPVVSRLKVLARMNIVERRRPQDGQFSISAAGREIDVRLATVATLYGEKAVLRLLDTKRSTVDMRGLGMGEASLAKFQHMLSANYGMIIAAGPTGAGKTTTLQCALRDMNTPDRNVSTLEDPVEYVVPGINHIPVNDGIGAGFAVQLRAILRQDPDVVLVGEVRDTETARIGVQAALAGRLLLTSLHAPDAVGAIYRLFQMEIEPHLVAAALRGVVAQRLLRRVCEYCAVSHPATAEQMLILRRHVDQERIHLRHGVGCAMCRGTGFRDRIGAFQILDISDRMRELISTRPEPGKLYELAAAEGLVTIADEAYALAVGGLTTVEEVARLVGTDV